MIEELAVENLGVVAQIRLPLRPGMTAITGETGAGKTLIVGALGLLCGARADAGLVRPGAAEALVQARFGPPLPPLSEEGGWEDEEEVILSRALSSGGRSRCSLSGRLVTVAMLGEAGSRLVEIHGQHASQALLSAASQREALDAFAGVDLAPLRSARARRAAAVALLSSLGGDRRAREREADLVAHQLQELDSAGLEDAGEEATLAALRDRLAALSEHKETIAAALGALAGDGADAGGGGAADLLGTVAQSLGRHGGLEAFAQRASALSSEASELASDLRAELEDSEEDPLRLEEVNRRLRLLADLRRKYGETLSEVIEFRHSLRARAEELASLDARAASAEAELAGAEAEIAAEESALGDARRKAAPLLAQAVEERLGRLGMPRARLEISLGEGPAAEPVTFLLGANPGEPAQPLAKVASGGELARAMLALRLVLGGGPPSAVFDEVDAGIGGEAALRVGEALADVARERQVLVVTHLAQVAAYADTHIALRKGEEGGRTVSAAKVLDHDERLVELARMLSGHPDSDAARSHAQELLASTRRQGQAGGSAGRA